MKSLQTALAVMGILGFLMVFGGVGGIEVEVDEFPMGLIWSIVGLILMLLAVIGIHYNSELKGTLSPVKKRKER